ncbi:hypothetical protein KKA47_06815 [bacterium]|nr:hypothetical protein [bacterium]
MMWQLINFIILFFIFLVFIGYPFNAFFITRSRVINSRITKAEDKKRDAITRLERYEKMIRNIDLEIKALRGELQHEGELERDTIIRKTEHVVQKTKENSQLMLNKLTEHANERVQKASVDVAIKKAKVIIKTKLREEDQERLIKSYLSRFEADYKRVGV